MHIAFLELRHSFCAAIRAAWIARAIMVKKVKTYVWLVTLPSGRKQEIDEQVAQKYLLGQDGATPFSKLSIERIVKLRPVKRSRAPVAEPEPPPTPHRINRLAGRIRRRAHRAVRPRPRSAALRRMKARRLSRVRTVIRPRRLAAARRIRKR
jgi:hypothetical protein